MSTKRTHSTQRTHNAELEIFEVSLQKLYHTMLDVRDLQRVILKSNKDQEQKDNDLKRIEAFLYGTATTYNCATFVDVISEIEDRY